MFFFEKKNQKTFASLAHAAGKNRDSDVKVFCFFSPIAIEADGAHWYRTWLMLRDSLVWWPWFDRSRAAQRGIQADFGAERLHRWTLDVMGSRESYADLIHAALSHDARRALMRLRLRPDLLLGGTSTPLMAYDDRLAALLPDARRIGRPGEGFLS